MAFVHHVSPEYTNAGHPDDRVRINSFLDVVDLELSTGLVDTTAVLINSINFSIGVHLHCGRDDLLMYIIVLLNIFSPHRYLSDARLLSAVAPLHARLLEFLRMYLETSSHRPLLTWQSPLADSYTSPQAYQTQQYGHTPYIAPAALSTYQSQPEPTFGLQSALSLPSNVQSAYEYSQNLQVAAASHDEQSSYTRLRYHCRPPVSRITLDFDNCTMLGAYLPGLVTLPNEQRELLKQLLVNVRICDQLDKKMLDQFGLKGPPKCPLAAGGCCSSQDPYSPSEHVPEEDWRAEFAMCVRGVILL